MPVILNVPMEFDEVINLQQLLVKRGWCKWTKSFWMKEGIVASFAEAIALELKNGM